MTDPAFFGYGSLVNLATHSYSDPMPASLPGWQRVWCTTTARDEAFLSVEPYPTGEIDGLTARVPGADWVALDLRETGYTRVDISVTHPHTALYRVQDELEPKAKGPILLSYLDVVVQGFHTIYGPAGVARFFDTTQGWDAPIRDDRAAPQYPRHQRLAPAETAMVDHHLRRVRG